MASTVTSKGQVTIPKEVRLFLKIKPSDKVDFSVEDGKVVLRPIKTLKDFRGSVSAKSGGNFDSERESAKKSVGNRVIEAME